VLRQMIKGAWTDAATVETKAGAVARRSGEGCRIHLDCRRTTLGGPDGGTAAASKKMPRPTRRPVALADTSFRDDDGVAIPSVT
jgi:hypothetical protein